MKTQEDFLKEILEIKNANPEMEIHFCADSQEIMESGWTAHRIQKVAINPWVEDDERIYTDEDEIKELFESQALDDEDSLKCSIEEHVEARYKSEVKKAICVYTQAG